MLERTLEPEVMDTIEAAEDYDAMDHSTPNANFVRRLIELGAHGRMLDIGTGPGHIPLLVCEEITDGTIVGIDLSENMLKIAERRRVDSPYADRIEFRLADAKGLPFADRSFDVVFSNTIMHHIPDPRPYLREAWRVLKPGGVFLIRDLFRPDSAQRVEELVAEHAAGATPEQQELFRVSFHAAFTPDELRAMLREVGLNEVEVVIDTDRHMSAQKKAGAPTNQRI